MDGGSAMNSYSGGGSLGIMGSEMILACSSDLPEEIPSAKPWNVDLSIKVPFSTFKFCLLVC